MRSIRTTGSELFSLGIAPGASAFTVKGVAYRGHVEYVDKFVPGGMSAMKAVLAPEIAAFFDQPFLAASRYDVFPLAQAGVACGQLSRLGFFEFVKIRAHYQADQDLKGVYSFVLKLTTAEAVAKRLPTLLFQFFNFGEVERVETTRDALEATLGGVPEPLAPWVGNVTREYMHRALSTAARRSVDVEAEIADRMGTHASGLPLTRITYRCRWG